MPVRLASSRTWSALATAVAALVWIPVAHGRELSVEERVAAQRAIEQVYWNHRIWPKENPTAKPPLSSVISDEAMHAKVEDYLKKSNALEAWWHRSVSAKQLQAELDRMSKRTLDPGRLRELYSALGSDSFVIAETLARQTLVERLIRNWYAFDDRFHAPLKARVEHALGGSPSIAQMKTLGGDYVESKLVRRGNADRVVSRRRIDDAIELDDEEWRTWREDVARRFGTAIDAIPAHRIGALHEDADAFSISAVLSSGSDEMVVASVTWPKRSFDEWWLQEGARTSAVVAAAAGEYAVAAPTTGECVNDTWELRFYAPSLRTRHTAVWTGTEMIVWGGFDGFNALNTGGRYNPSTDSWTRTSIGANVPSARHVHTAVWTGTQMIVWAGEAVSNGGFLNSGGRYDPMTDNWKAVSTGTGVPTPRSYHTAVWTGSEMIVWGGWDGGSIDTGGRYDPSMDSWTATSAGVLTPRSYHTAVWTGTEMIVWGGHDTSDDQSTGGQYDPAADTWKATSVDAGVPSPREFHTAVWTGAEMIIWGGSRAGTSFDSGSRYDPATRKWTATSNGPAARSSHTAVWTGSQMIVWGGSGAVVMNSGSRYTPATDTWAAMSTGAGVPTARNGHSAVWTGTEMIIWGGADAGNTSLNTGSRYAPATNTWAATSTGLGVPTGRTFSTAVWTGTEMIIWGGSYQATGGRYNLATDTWTPTSVNGAPAGRSAHTAVWTGTRMIVWGGLGVGGTILNTGGWYQVTTNSWQSTSTSFGVPSPRGYHTAVWTGTEMIVWGGTDGLNWWKTGGRYSVGSNSWVATSTGANTPSGREWHSAVWTGTTMIVWGGYNGFDDVNTGGRYTPTTNSWTSTSSGSNLPTSREAHTAVWTGTRMIVWGGVNLAGNMNTGGRYDPAAPALSWTPTSVGMDVPEPRDFHTAVWTGSEMIVWGGRRDGVPLETGGRYRPDTDSWVPTSTGANAPPARTFQNAVWTGERMLVWGGYPLDTSLGLYCVSSCVAPTTFHRDADGDGYGNPASSAQSCDSLPGYVIDGTDCDDGQAAIHPGATEVCNGVDDDCDTVVDDGAQPGEVASVAASKSVTTVSFDWSATAGAARYDVLRGTLGVWPVGSHPGAENCLDDDIAGSPGSDASPLPEGSGYWYLVRAENGCGNGGYGSQEDHGVPTVQRVSSTCP